MGMALPAVTATLPRPTATRVQPTPTLAATVDFPATATRIVELATATARAQGTPIAVVTATRAARDANAPARAI